MQLVHLASKIVGVPLLIARSKLDIILSVVGSRIGMHSIETSLPISSVKNINSLTQNGIAIIPVFGTLVKRTVGLEAASGLTSYTEITKSLELALADPKIKGILLEIDSHGGEASGVFELAQRIREANQKKPVWAHANDSAYSAAYALAASASRLSLSQTAGVGSIGVIALHIDQSVKDAQDGLTFNAIYAGSHKNDLSPHEPLTPQAEVTLKEEVNRLYQLFVNQVSQMRNLDANTVRSTEAGLYFGENALTMGLADAVCSFEQTLNDFHHAINIQTSVSQCNKPSSQLLLEKNMIEDKKSLDTIEKQKEEALCNVNSNDPITHHSNPSNESTYAQAQVIAELCLIAGNPSLAAEFIAANMNETQVRQTLLNLRAKQNEITSRITAEVGTIAQAEHSPVMDAVKKLIHRGV